MLKFLFKQLLRKWVFQMKQIVLSLILLFCCELIQSQTVFNPNDAIVDYVSGDRPLWAFPLRSTCIITGLLKSEFAYAQGYDVTITKVARALPGIQAGINVIWLITCHSVSGIPMVMFLAPMTERNTR